MPDRPSQGIAAFGAGKHFAERAAHAQSYPLLRDADVDRVNLDCSHEQILDLDKPLGTQAAPVQALARAHLASLRAVLKRAGGVDAEDQHGADASAAAAAIEMASSDVLDAANGSHLLLALFHRQHAVHADERGYEAGTDFHRIPLFESGQQEELLRAGLAAIRYSDVTADYLYQDQERGTFYRVLDSAVVQRPEAIAHFSLDFSDQSPELRQYADDLNSQWLLLEGDVRDAVCKAVGLARRTNQPVRLPCSEGVVQANPELTGGVAWRVIDADRVLNQGTQRLPCDEQPRIEHLSELERIAESWRALARDEALSDPSRAKDLLTASRWHVHAAMDWREWRRSDAGNGGQVGAAEAVETIIGELAAARGKLEAAVEERSRDAAWQETFDRAGWNDRALQEVAVDLQSYMATMFSSFVAQERALHTRGHGRIVVRGHDR